MEGQNIVKCHYLYLPVFVDNISFKLIHITTKIINNLVPRPFFIVLNILWIGNNFRLKCFMYFVGKSYLIGSFPSLDGWFISIGRLRNAGDFFSPIP